MSEPTKTGLPETIGRILAPIAAAVAPIIAERLARELRENLPGIVDQLADRVIERLPDLSHLDEAIVALIKGAIPDLGKLDQIDDILRAAIREAFNSLPFPFKF
ncbi:hypothetical protein I5G81_gp96 [Mycobacterium phage Shandong1]|uniref:Uncharacterized protein n=1 Tax=Mycobacterium phage Shandong1 TaxID=1983447 RepID=A0A1X9SHC5_9CAUD|nr:hypothetical protein I5G81_gp96 [Mycobacterium phage Shandong1]ARQ95535.1 hypothetical protein [Mycobacterium phage Shandong1]